MELDVDDLGTDALPQEVASETQSAAPEHVGDAVREAYELARDKAEAGDDPEKLEAIRVKRARDGRFERAADDDTKGPPKAAQAPSEGQEKVTAENQEQREPDGALSLKPPVGWNAQARAAYATLPPYVQQAVAQREVDVNKGFAVLQEYKGLEEFTPVIRAAGLTHAQFTKNAVEWERSLQTHPVQTVMHAAQLGRIDMVQLARAILAQHEGQSQQGQPTQQRQPQPLQPQQIEQIVEQRLTAREQVAAEAKASQTAQEFLDDPKNVHAEAVVDEMVALIQSGRAVDLPSAYDMAIWARPDIRALLIKQQGSSPSNGNPRRAADQARLAARATTGAPTGKSPASKSTEYSSVREAVRAAYASQLENS